MNDRPFKPVIDGKCPHKREATVNVQFRNGSFSKDVIAARLWRWDDTQSDFDIVASRLAA